MNATNGTARRPAVAVPAIAESVHASDGVWITFPQRRRATLGVRILRWIGGVVRSAGTGVSRIASASCDALVDVVDDAPWWVLLLAYLALVIGTPLVMVQVLVR